MYIIVSFTTIKGKPEPSLLKIQKEDGQSDSRIAVANNGFLILYFGKFDSLYTNINVARSHMYIYSNFTNTCIQTEKH